MPQRMKWHRLLGWNRNQIKELFDANMFVDTLEYFFAEVDKEGI